MTLILERQPKEFYTILEKYVIDRAKELKGSKYWFLVEEAKWCRKEYDEEKKTFVEKCFDLDVNKWINEYDEGRRLNPDLIFTKQEPGKKPSPTDEYMRAESYRRWLLAIGDYDNFLRFIEEDWLKKHEKFVEFCAQTKPQIVGLIKKSESGKKVFVSMDNMIKEMEGYHTTHPKALNIYSKNDMIVGLQYCLSRSTPKIDVGVSHDERYITFVMAI